MIADDIVNLFRIDYFRYIIDELIRKILLDGVDECDFFIDD